MLISGRELSLKTTFLGHWVTHYTVFVTGDGFTAKAEAAFMLVTWSINIQKKKRKEKSTKRSSLDSTGCKTILGRE